MTRVPFLPVVIKQLTYVLMSPPLTPVSPKFPDGFQWVGHSHPVRDRGVPTPEVRQRDGSFEEYISTKRTSGLNSHTPLTFSLDSTSTPPPVPFMSGNGGDGSSTVSLRRYGTGLGYLFPSQVNHPYLWAPMIQLEAPGFCLYFTSLRSGPMEQPSHPVSSVPPSPSPTGPSTGVRLSQVPRPSPRGARVCPEDTRSRLRSPTHPYPTSTATGGHGEGRPRDPSERVET